MTQIIPDLATGTDPAAQRASKLAQITEAFGNPFHVTQFDKRDSAAALHAQHKDLPAGEKTEVRAAIAGRVMAIRNSGMFLDVLDDSGRLQVFHPIKDVAPEVRTLLGLLDLGDIVGVEGSLRRTPRGELTLDADRLVLLAKALESPPEKYHGLKDVDFRYRHREQDLVATEKSRLTLRRRSLIVRAIRRALDERGFLEVETPILHATAGGAIAKPFQTHHNALDIPLSLRIATELHLKRLVIGGLSEKVYEIGRLFRNEGISPRHNPEFTTIELYQAYVDYEEMIRVTELLVSESCRAVHSGTTCTFDGVTLDFTPPFRRASLFDLIEERTGVDFRLIVTRDAVAAEAGRLGVPVDPAHNRGQIIEAVFGHTVEATLVQPTHVLDLPKEISPLAKAWPDRPDVAQRFETYCNGWEIANAYSELNDPREQRRNFEAQAAQKAAGNPEAPGIDEEFLKAMSFGMPPMGGLGIGIDRLVMLLTDSQTIREVIAFPTLRPLRP
ncbi:lysine--tRNA ligase [Methylobacterium terricola]|uniref:Lysine--tRNA ligase n=1 Tax=Methylobacterium terricola TaxID=2583531 RepID=A0A5C4LNU7_9HYPH|nr:lysine--tRNA ligase [Methylobacterium terricola]TNC15920.1 lysine--tRNA ligase [Methylobacterium terricola]